MFLAGAQGAVNQVINNISSTSAKTESADANTSFLSAVKEVSENLVGKIVVAGGADIAEPELLKHKFIDESGAGGEEEDVFDFIRKIEDLLKKNRNQ
jgi:hypothetical protein